MFDNRARVIIKEVEPRLEEGRYPIKRVVGQDVVVEADIFADGHDSLAARLRYRHNTESAWVEVPMQYLQNDHWRSSFKAERIGGYSYTIIAWIDHFKSWRRDLVKRIEAEEKDLQVYLRVGASLIAEAGGNIPVFEQPTVRKWAETLSSDDIQTEVKTGLALSDEVSLWMENHPDNRLATRYLPELQLIVEPVRALFGSWYEIFPRSCSPEAGKHGNFADCEGRLSNIAKMGFDVLYLPPIHPIGITNRKGKNNALHANPGDPGTPWAIGSPEGGHKSIHPQLGNLSDFRHLLQKAQEYGIEVAMDMAFQCSPDHPYVKEHPDWFIWRPDGTIQYAENPPKKYEDILPLNFESEDWQNLWQELKGVVFYWIDQGVHIFRVDNPHTKSFYFWEWLISQVKKEHPEVIFLAEAFTRPNVMFQLALIGFSQSYTYFAWRNTRWDLTRYLTEITRAQLQDFFRPNLWPNTPDILTEYLQSGGRPAFMARLVLAATLGASYGIYGPAFELCENIPQETGSEEYLHSEKYEIKHWDVDSQESLADFIARVNLIRRENIALQENANLVFHPVDNDRLICYSKRSGDLSNIILVIVNLDPDHTHSGWLELPLDVLGLDAKQSFQVHDLLSGARFLWNGSRNYVELNPKIVPAHIFRIRRRIRSEKDFDYYL